MPERTTTQIEAEIKALEACKSYIPRDSSFGDNNHRNLDLQIEELRDGIDDTADEWNDYSESEQSAIMEARYWKDGDEDESPSSGWDNYKPDAKKRAKAQRQAERRRGEQPNDPGERPERRKEI